MFGAFSQLYRGPLGHLIPRLPKIGKEIDQPPNRPDLYRLYAATADKSLSDLLGLASGQYDQGVIEDVLSST